MQNSFVEFRRVQFPIKKYKETTFGVFALTNTLYMIKRGTKGARIWERTGFAVVR